MRLTVRGIGYLGLTLAVCMADLGHEVFGLDADAKKVARADSGEMPFFESGPESLLRKNLDAGRLRFTTSSEDVAGFGNVHFICVGTPRAEDGSADPTFIKLVRKAWSFDERDSRQPTLRPGVPESEPWGGTCGPL